MSIDLQLGISGMAEVERRLTAIARAYEQIGAAQGTLSRGLQAGAPAPGAAHAAAAERAIAEKTRAAPRERFFTGPSQRLAQIEEQRQRAKQIEDDQERQRVMADLDILHFRADRSRILGERRLAQGKDALEAPGLLDLFQGLNQQFPLLDRNLRNILGAMRMIHQTGVGVGMMGGAGGAGVAAAGTRGLGGQLIGGAAGGAATRSGGMAAVAGIAARVAALLTGPIGIAVVATVAVISRLRRAFRFLADSARFASEQLGQIRSAGRVAGATGGEITQLAALGVAPGDVPGLSAGLRQTMTTDPFGRMSAMQVGVHALPRPFGDTNEAKLLLDVLDGLRELGKGEQLRAMQNLGIEGLAPLLDISDRTRESLRETGDMLEKAFPKRFQQEQSEFAAQLGRVRDGFKAIRGVIAGPALFIGTQALKFAADRLRDIFKGFQAFAEFLSTNPATRWMIDLTKKAFNLQDAQRENTDALRQNTQAIQQGTFGGGERARGAVPRSLQGPTLQRALESNALRLGAFSL